MKMALMEFEDCAKFVSDLEDLKKLGILQEIRISSTIFYEFQGNTQLQDLLTSVEVDRDKMLMGSVGELLGTSLTSDVYKGQSSMIQIPGKYYFVFYEELPIKKVNIDLLSLAQQVTKP